MTLPSPYIARRSGDLILAADWNEFQRRFRAELADHKHTGGEQGNQLDGNSFDPNSTLRVAELHVADKLIVGDRDVGAELAAAPVFDDASMPGSLVVKGNLTVGGTLRVGKPAALRASVKSGTTLAYTGHDQYTTLLSLTLDSSSPGVYLVELRANIYGLIRPGYKDHEVVGGLDTLRFDVSEAGVHTCYHEVGYFNGYKLSEWGPQYLRTVLPVVVASSPITVALIGYNLVGSVEVLELVAIPLLGSAHV